MIRTFGQQPSQLPPGMLVAVRFPVLNRVDVETGDHRIIDSAGFATRELPVSIRMQERESYGHDGAIVTGALYEVTVDPESQLASGRGFLLDNEDGRKHALYIATMSMRGNSVDLVDVEARFEEDLDTGDYRIRFTKANIAATTGVGTPAFADARAEIDGEITAAMYDAIGEIMASIAAHPMEELVCEFDTFHVNVLAMERSQLIPAEVLASGIVQPSAAFFRPEAGRLQKIVLTADNHVYGHLGSWSSCHDGIEGQCVIIPRPTDGYASFNKPGVLTERGIVETGPIFAYGGHRRAAGRPSLEEAYGGIENAWADVRITEGIHGPWISGIVRPGVDDKTVYAARASRVSGHWVDGRLKAVVSVNSEGFDVPGTGEIDFLPELAAGFAFSLDKDGLVSELVASFPPCAEEPVVQPAVIQVTTGNTPGTHTLTVNGAGMTTEGFLNWLAVDGQGTIVPAEIEHPVIVEASSDDEEATTMLLYELLAEE